MKALLSALVLTMTLTGSAMAHCGKCGMGEAKTEAAAAHSGAQCPMHGEKNAVLTEAAKALETSNPGLSAKLSDMAANCCDAH